MNLIIFIVAILACCRAYNVNRDDLINDIENRLKSNSFTKKNKHARYFVTLTQRPKEITVYKPGTTVELTCEGIGAPAPNIRWFKNNNPVYEHDQESNDIAYTSQGSLARLFSTLLVVNPIDKDEYTCVIAAKAKSLKATTIIRSNEVNSDDVITERSKLLPREPRILTAYKIFVETLGNHVVLPCKARGYPRPRVVWRDSKGNLIKNDSHIKVLRSGKLEFSPLRWSDMGEYTCEAFNAFGSQRVTTFVYPAKAG